MISSPQVLRLLNLSFTRKVSKNLPLHLSFFVWKTFSLLAQRKSYKKKGRRASVFTRPRYPQLHVPRWKTSMFSRAATVDVLSTADFVGFIFL